MVSIRELEGIGQADGEKLAEHGVRTTDQLLEIADTASKRLRFADETHISEDKLLRWVHQADLLRVTGVDETLAALLVGIDVVSVPRLAYCRASSLHNDLQDTAAQQQLPTEKELEQMIAMAKKLPKRVHH